MYFREAMAIVLCFSLTDEKSFENLGRWLEEIDDKAMTSNFIRIIVGNKCDDTKNRVISTEKADQFAKKNNWIYMESSAKTGLGIDKLFSDLSSDLYMTEVTGGFKQRETLKTDARKLKRRKKNKDAEKK